MLSTMELTIFTYIWLDTKKRAKINFGALNLFMEENMLDSQGRVSLYQEFCKKNGFEAGGLVEFVMLSPLKYKIIPKGTATEDEDVVIAPERALDIKYRVFVPAEIRRLYTNRCILTTNKKSEIILNFFEFKEKNTKKILKTRKRRKTKERAYVFSTYALLLL